MDQAEPGSAAAVPDERVDTHTSRRGERKFSEATHQVLCYEIDIIVPPALLPSRQVNGEHSSVVTLAIMTLSIVTRNIFHERSTLLQGVHAARCSAL